MRLISTFVFAPVLLLSQVAYAAENGAMIRAGELKAQPFVDAATTDSVAANQAITIIGRQGGWAQVESNGKTGWVRVLNVRMQVNPSSTSGSGKPAARPTGSASPASLFRTGSSGKTVTTGIKGLGEEDIRNATVNEAQLEVLATLAVPAADAMTNAQQSGLKENSVQYLKDGGKK